MGNIMDKKSIDEFFDSLTDEELKEKFDKYERPENMNKFIKYRFKTKEEFIMDGLWNEEFQTPRGWNDEGEMNHYMGKDVPSEFNQLCDTSERLSIDGWDFRSEDYVLKEESKNWVTWVPKKEINANGFEYFGDTLMEVSEDGRYWEVWVVFGKKMGKYIAWDCTGDLGKAREECLTFSWKYARPIKTKLTLQQIADKFGLNKDEIEII